MIICYTSHPLQNLLLPLDDSVPGDLYLKGEGFAVSGESLVLSKGGQADFFSYFNLISWGKWQNYTGIERLSFAWELEGEGKLTFTSWNHLGEACKEWSLMVTGGGETELPSHLLEGKIGRHISLKLTSKRGCRLLKGAWKTMDAPHVRDVRPVLAFCTYNRDEYLFPNLELIKNRGGEGSHVFVVDNASRIEKEQISSLGDNFHLFSNPNLGGSGGFTRAMAEALESPEVFTHIILMDDDIRLEPGAIGRTKNLLSLLKPTYHKHFTAGAMLQLDHPDRLFELTANWNGVRVKNNKRDTDLTDPASLCRADDEANPKNQYAAWWYCAIPLNPDMKDDLPFPFFIYGDDMDYSLRRAGGILTMNGIGVWHEPFTKKFSPLFKSYFFCRNTQILNALHGERYGFFKAWLNSAAHFYVQLFVHDYRSAELALDGTEDFLRGPGYIASLNEEKLLKEKYRKTEFREWDKLLLDRSYPINDNFNRYASPWYFCHKRLAVYAYDKKKAEIRERQYKRVFSLLNRRHRLFRLYLRRYRCLIKEYGDFTLNRTLWHDRFERTSKEV